MERFWAKVDTSGGPDACWPWTASLLHDGYGQFKLCGRNRKAPRVAWELTNGPAPEHLCVLHRCDNPACCNPGHLFLGTNADNIADRHGKGRSARGRRNGASKLTEADVRAVRERHAAGESMTALGAAFGVHRSAIRFVVIRRNWVHVP